MKCINESHLDLCLSQVKEEFGEDNLIISQPYVSVRETVITTPAESKRTEAVRVKCNDDSLAMKAFQLDQGIAELMEKVR